MLPIVHSPNSVLSQKARPVRLKNGKLDPSLVTFIEEMKQALASVKDPEGVGLAAPQVGRSLQIFIVKPSPKAEDEVFINPIITPSKDNSTFSYAELAQHQPKRKGKKPQTLEGCLSLPTIWGEVKRYPSIYASYYDENGQKHEKIFIGFVATIIQHEYDHLQGILFPKRVLEQNAKLYKSHKNEKGEDVFEEIQL